MAHEVAVMDVVRLWRRLAEEWRERGPIESALVGAAPALELEKVGFYLAGVAEQNGIDATDLLAFGNHPDPGKGFDGAMVVVQRVALAATPNRPEMAPTPARSLPAADKPFLTVDEVAARLDVGRDTVIRHIEAGRLVASDIGTASERCYRISAADLEHFILATATAQPSAESRANRSAKRRPRGSAYKPQTLARS